MKRPHASLPGSTKRTLQLLLAAALLFHSPAAAQSPALAVCVSPRSPFIMYNATIKEISGYEWDLFSLVATALSLNFTTRVLPWDTMMSALTLPPSDPDHCDIAPSAIPLTFPIPPVPGSLKYSNPTFRSGYAIATSVEWDPFDMWSFGRVFSTELWAALISSAVGLAILAYLAERDFTTRGLGKTKYPVALKPGMYEALYTSVGKLFNIVQDLRVTSLPGKLISLAWGFLVLVVISMYTGVVTARLTATNPVTRVQGLADLQSGMHTAIVADTLVNNFTRYKFTPKGVPLGTEEQQLAALAMVASGAADAIVAEAPWLTYQLQNRCDLVIVDSMFKLVSNVILFSPSTDDNLVYQVNSQLSSQQADGMYEALQAVHMKTQIASACTTTSYVITLKQLEGLWYIMLAFVGLAAVVLLLPRLSKNFELDTGLSRSTSTSTNLTFNLSWGGKSLFDRGPKHSNAGTSEGLARSLTAGSFRGSVDVPGQDFHLNPSAVQPHCTQVMPAPSGPYPPSPGIGQHGQHGQHSVPHVATLDQNVCNPEMGNEPNSKPGLQGVV